MKQVTNLSVDVLKVHSRNQEFFDDIEGEQYERFKKSIKEDGIITPLIVAPDMTIISGHQRYKAAKDLGIKLIPVIIKEELIDEDEKLKKLIASNFGRMKNNPVKQGKMLKVYEKLCGVQNGGDRKSERKNCVLITQDDIAKELGVSVRTIQNLKKLQTLSPELQQLIEDGTVKYTTALNVWAKLPNHEQKKLIETLGRDYISTLTQNDTKGIIEQLKQGKKEAEQRARQLEEENRQLKNQKPEVVEREVVKEVIPEHIKEKMQKLEQEKEALEERAGNLDRAKMELSEYQKRKREIEKEMHGLMKTLRELQEKYDIKNTNLANQTRLLNLLREKTRPLEESKTEIEQLCRRITGISAAGRAMLMEKVEFLYDLADFISERASTIEVEAVYYGQGQ